MTLFKRLQAKAAGNAEVRFLTEYREWITVQELGVVRLMTNDGLHTPDQLGARGAAGHRRIFQMMRETSTARGLLQETKRMNGAEMLCISQWLDVLGSPEAYKAMLETLDREGVLPKP